MPRSEDSLKLARFVLALLFTGLAVYGSLTPFRFSPVQFDEALERLSAGGLCLGGSDGRIDVAVNFLLFVPICYSWLDVLVGGRRRVMPVAAAVPLVLVASVLLSLTVELTQAWFPPRVPSLRDVLAQTVGAGVGAAIWLIAGRTVSAWLQGYLSETRPTRQVDWLLQAYVLGLLIYSVMPLDLTIDPRELYRKYDAGRIALIPFAYDHGSWLRALTAFVADALVFVPVGMLATSVYTTGSALRRFGPSLLLGLAIALAIELCQLPVLSRFTDTTDLIAGAIGVAVGIGLMRRWRAGEACADGPPVKDDREALAWGWLIAAALYALVLVALFWAPFDFLGDKIEIKGRLEGFFAVPLDAAIGGSPFAALAALLRELLLFVPLGVLLALSVARLARRFRRMALAVFLLFVWGLGMGIELGQTALPGRSAVFDDTLVYLLGALIGAGAASRVLHDRRRPTEESERAEPRGTME